MSYKTCLLPASILFLTLNAAAIDVPLPTPKLSAAQVAEKNSAVKGGTQAWRAVQTMILTGKLTAGGNQRATVPNPIPGQHSVGRLVQPRPVEPVQLPFVMQLKRPRKLRFELQFRGETALQVSDGVNGWKLRPFLNRRVVEPYTPEEVKIASLQADLDGPLMDYAAKGNRVELEGIEKVDDRDNYKLRITLSNGQSTNIWIDALTFLETKIGGPPRQLDGVYHQVEIYFRDFRTVSGLQVPFLMETRVLPAASRAAGFRSATPPPEKTMIESVIINRNLDDSLFGKPEIQVAAAATH